MSYLTSLSTDPKRVEEQKRKQKRIGRNIERRRKALHLTQRDLADRLGYSGAAICNWEHGMFSIPAHMVPEIAEALEFTIKDLFK